MALRGEVGSACRKEEAEPLIGPGAGDGLLPDLISYFDLSGVSGLSCSRRKL
jgi:hypothetical protein